MALSMALFWKREKQKVPETTVHQRLGQQKIKKICQGFGLIEDEEKIIDELLDILMIFFGQTKKE